jgi:hypothetical protein
MVGQKVSKRRRATAGRRNLSMVVPLKGIRLSHTKAFTKRASQNSPTDNPTEVRKEILKNGK